MMVEEGEWEEEKPSSFREGLCHPIPHQNPWNVTKKGGGGAVLRPQCPLGPSTDHLCFWNPPQQQWSKRCWVKLCWVNRTTSPHTYPAPPSGVPHCPQMNPVQVHGHSTSLTDSPGRKLDKALMVCQSASTHSGTNHLRRTPYTEKRLGHSATWCCCSGLAVTGNITARTRSRSSLCVFTVVWKQRQTGRVQGPNSPRGACPQ